jgi:hypothetical protein
MQMLNKTQQKVISRKYQQFRRSNSFSSAVLLTAKWAEKFGVQREETRKTIYKTEVKRND